MVVASAAVLLEKDGKILLIRRNYPPFKGKLGLIGGYLNDGESPEEGAIREAKEETGLDVEVVEELGRFNFFYEKDKVVIAFVCRIIKGQVKSSHEGEVLWKDL